MIRKDKMRFGSLVWTLNPEDIRVSTRRRITSYSRGDRFTLMDSGSTPASITCSGCFFGADAGKTVAELEKYMAEGKVLPLHIPGREVTPAKLSAVEQEGKPGIGAAGYKLSFQSLRGLEDVDRGSFLYGNKYIALGGESLWDVAYSFSTTVEKLVELNPQVPHINCLREGEEICLNSV